MSKQYGSEDFIASLVTKVKLHTFTVDGTSCLTFLAYGLGRYGTSFKKFLRSTCIGTFLMRGSSF
jgi:hypothetical protein